MSAQSDSSDLSDLSDIKTICIAGTASGVGKTSVAEMLLHALKGWSAAKISLNENLATKHSFTIVFRGPHLEKKGSDTARMAAAGARRVIWICARRSAVNAAIRQMLRGLRPKEKIIVEGNSFARFACPNLTILVARVGQRSMKPSARLILPRVNMVVLVAARDATADEVRAAKAFWRRLIPATLVYVIRSLRRGNPALIRQIRNLL